MSLGVPGSGDCGAPVAECDCSGYICWALGISRETNHPLYEKFNGGGINADAIVMDAKHASAQKQAKLSESFEFTL